MARGIPNQPGPAELPRLQALCLAVLDPLREAVGRPLKVNSGYRSPALNAAIPGSSSTSQHSLGEAADLQCPGMNTATLFKSVIRLGLPFDQLIYEAKNASSIWVHVSHRVGANRGQVLIAHFAANGKVSYSAVTREAALAIPEATRSLMAEPELTYEEVADEPRPRAPRAPRKTAVTTAVKAVGKTPAKTVAKTAAKTPAKTAAKRAAKTPAKAAVKKAPAKTRSAKTSARP